MEYILDEGFKLHGLSKPIKYKIENECWVCISHPLSKDGYPRISRKGKIDYIHRYAYILFKGNIPENHVVMHSCDNPSCINPNHLSTGTHLDNMKDMKNKNRQAKTTGPGELNGYSKLTKDIVLKIYNSKKTQSKIAKEFGISQALVSKIKTKKIWRHLHE